MADKQETPNSDQWLAYRGRFVNVTFLIRSGDDEYLVRIRDGVVQDIKRGPHVMPRWSFALSSDPQS